MKKLLLILLCLPLLFTTCKKEDEVPTIPTLLGCTDSTACNYDYSANTDNGSCLTDYGCTDEGAFNYDSEATCDDGSCIHSLAIGDYYQGGIIFYLDGNGGGLIVNTAGNVNQHQYQWGCGGTYISGANGTAIGTGAQNTIAIEAECPSSSAAANFCANFYLEFDIPIIGDSIHDWFLPSKDELNEIYLNKDAIGGLEDTYYWSSTQSSTYEAWTQHFGSGSNYSNPKSNTIRVRPIRAF